MSRKDLPSKADEVVEIPRKRAPRRAQNLTERLFHAGMSLNDAKRWSILVGALKETDDEARTIMEWMAS